MKSAKKVRFAVQLDHLQRDEHHQSRVNPVVKGEAPPGQVDHSLHEVVAKDGEDIAADAVSARGSAVASAIGKSEMPADVNMPACSLGSMDDAQEACPEQQCLKAHHFNIPPQAENLDEAQKEQKSIMQAIQDLDNQITAAEGSPDENLQNQILLLACRHARLNFIKLNWVDL